MNSLFILVPVSIGMGAFGLAMFFWAMRLGQFDDPEGNAWRVIHPKKQSLPEADRDT